MIKTLYEKLYNETNIQYRYDGRKRGLSELSHFVAMKGCKYDKDTVRLFVIGRAVNGWELQLPCTTAADLESGQPEYYLSRSPFWRTVEKIWRQISCSDDFRFVDHIAWSNLYKIAPKTGGNPTTTMCKKQFPACWEILKAEIRAYKPTHILFVTGYDWWYSYPLGDFSTLFKEKKRLGSNNKDKNIYVEGTAIYELDSKNIPVVITCRPERRLEAKLVEAAVAAFSE